MEHTHSDPTLRDQIENATEAPRAIDPPESGRRRALTSGAIAGAMGALAAAGVSLWAGERYGGVVTAQLLADRITGVTPVSVFGRVLQELESNAKPLTLIGLTAAQALVGAAIGAAYSAIGARQMRWSLPLGAVVLSAVMWLLLAFVAAPLGQVGALALDAPGGATKTLLLFAASAAAFGFITAMATDWLVAVREPAAHVPSRRRLAGGLGFAALAVPALAAGGYTTRHALRLRKSSSTAPAPISEESAEDDGGPFAFKGMPQFVTPTSEFYVVSKNIIDPTVDGASWTLEIDGMVRQPLRLSLTDVLARESVEFSSTLECISNSVGGHYISTAVWRGFPLVELLEEAGLEDGVVDLELHAADGYVESIPLAEGLAPDTMLVHGINGEPLNDKHGFPARLIVPGIFGMKNVKWLTRVVAVNEDIRGYWQQRGWSDPAPVLTMSRIDVPRNQAKVDAGEPFLAGGVAFAGDRGISRVEVSFDRGETWREAELSDVPGDLTWRLWRIEHTFDETGPHDIRVRATDGHGETQTDERNPSLPNGATGHHSVRVMVEGDGSSAAPRTADDEVEWPRQGGQPGDGG